MKCSLQSFACPLLTWPKVSSVRSPIALRLQERLSLSLPVDPRLRLGVMHILPPQPLQMLLSLSSTKAGARSAALPGCSSAQSNIKAPAPAPLQNPLSFKTQPSRRRSCEGKQCCTEWRAVCRKALCSYFTQ